MAILLAVSPRLTVIWPSTAIEGLAAAARCWGVQTLRHLRERHR
jgi:hypothetical protein